MWIKAEDGILYNTDHASTIGYSQSPMDRNAVKMVGARSQATDLAHCGSPEAAKELVDRIAKAINDGRHFFDVSEEPRKWEVS